MLARLVLGAALGIGVGALFVGVGLVRAVIFLLAGARLNALDADDLRAIAYYVGGFGVGGALFGALKPALRGKIGIYAGSMLVGVIVTLAIALSAKGSFGALDAVDWLALPGLGMLFGAAVAYGWTRSPD